MFVQDFKVIEQPYDDVAFRFAGGMGKILEAGLTPAREEGERLRVKVGPKGWPAALAKSVEISIGQVRDSDESTIVAFSWEAIGKGSLFPRFEGDIEIAPFGLKQTVLTVRGSYVAPGGSFGARADELVLHRVAESTLRAFLDGLCASLECARVPI